MLLKITEKCSMGCTHCMNNATPDGKHMTMETLNDVLDFVIGNQAYERLLVTGGEPTEHPEFVKMIETIIDKLASTGYAVVLTILTNGFWCLDNVEACKKLNNRNPNIKLLWQVSTDSRFYPKALPLHKRLWREREFVICPDCVDRVYPQGRALENNLEWEAKASKCFNIRAMTKQLEFKSIGIIVEAMMVRGYVCTPAIRIDGGISLGESDLCPKVATIYDSEEEIIQKIIDFKCHQCDFINDKLDEKYRQFL